MKTIKLSAIALLLVLFCQTSFISAQNQSVEPFLGSWALTLDYESNSAGWCEIRLDEGYLDADVLWRWGSVYGADFVFIQDDQLFMTSGSRLVRKKDKDGNPLKTHQYISWINARVKEDGSLAGTAFFPNQDGIGVESVGFTGEKIPAQSTRPDLSKVTYGKPEKLFNGKDLTGWELLEKGSVNGWKAVDGVLVNDPVQKEGEHVSYGNLRTTKTFKDFNIKVEVNVPKGSNSGIYMRGIYEVQVMDSYGEKLNPHNMGALYSRITPSVAAEKPAGEWQAMDITLCKRHLTVILNGKKIIDNEPVKGVTGGAMTSDEFNPGPIYLQGDHGKISYRNIVLTPIVE
ncbi:MAG: DUF1080 domain-containing protein [Bacteroidales bacterium]|nr:DUF1080 domain-containing protein [Bacteroidales bacterium]